MFAATVDGQSAVHNTFEGYLGMNTLTEQQLQAMQCTPAVQQHQRQQQTGASMSAQLSTAAAEDLKYTEQYQQGLAGGPLHAGAAATYTAAGTTPTGSTRWESQTQLQWTAAPFNACPPELGFVSPYGQEFAGCLPQFNDDGTSNTAIMQAYIATLDAAAAARHASGSNGPG
jgi:hypothetical protein